MLTYYFIKFYVMLISKANVPILRIHDAAFIFYLLQ